MSHNLNRWTVITLKVAFHGVLSVSALFSTLSLYFTHRYFNARSYIKEYSFDTIPVLLYILTTLITSYWYVYLKVNYVAPFLELSLRYKLSFI